MKVFKWLEEKSGLPIITPNGTCPHCKDSCDADKHATDINWTKSVAYQNTPIGFAAPSFKLTQCQHCRKYCIDYIAQVPGPPFLFAIELTKTLQEIKDNLVQNPEREGKGGPREGKSQGLRRIMAGLGQH